MAAVAVAPIRGQWLRAFRILIGFAFRTAPREALLFWLCGAIMALWGPWTALGAKLLVDGALGGDLTGALVAAAVLALAAGVGLVNTLYYLDFLFTVAERASAAVNRRLIELMAGLPGLAHHERPEYLRELDLLREERGMLGWLTNATAGLIRVAVQLGASLVLLSRLDPLLLLLPLLGLGSFLAGRRANELEIRAWEETAEPERLRQHLFEQATSAAAGKELRVFGLADRLIARHHAAAEQVVRARDRADWRAAALHAAGSLLFGVGYVGAVGLVLLRAVEGRATPGDVVLAVGVAAGLNYAVQVAVGYGTGFLRILRIAQRYLWLEDYAAASRVEAVAPRPGGTRHPAPVPSRLDDGIELRDVSFRYPGTETKVLDRVSLRLPAGSVVALVGENGAGKTTLVKLLNRFYEPDEGQILVDGVELPRLPLEGWRSRVSAAFQDFSRFEFRLRETVGVGHLPLIEDAPSVRSALERAGGDDVPNGLPCGIETQLGKGWQDGVELSGGQWQKLALGRAMMRPTPLLVVFDEPTAALDAQTEHRLFERFAAAARDGERAGTVTILVTHRFSTVRMADLIVVLEPASSTGGAASSTGGAASSTEGGGRVVEVGSHAELVRRGGLYAELYELQSRVYR
jgi:ATP-binding cassette subfamily B protein